MTHVNKYFYIFLLFFSLMRQLKKPLAAPFAYDNIYYYLKNSKHFIQIFFRCDILHCEKA